MRLLLLFCKISAFERGVAQLGVITRLFNVHRIDNVAFVV